MPHIGALKQNSSGGRTGAGLVRRDLVAPMVGGLVVLLVLIGLIGTAIRDPRPHDIPVGLVGPSAAVQQISDKFAGGPRASSSSRRTKPKMRHAPQSTRDQWQGSSSSDRQRQS